MAMAMAKPSRVDVPRPSSSIIARLLPLIFLCQVMISIWERADHIAASYLKMKAISLISTEKVDIFASMQSSVEVREKRLWMIGNEAYSAGTKHPI